MQNKLVFHLNSKVTVLDILPDGSIAKEHFIYIQHRDWQHLVLTRDGDLKLIPETTKTILLPGWTYSNGGAV